MKSIARFLFFVLFMLVVLAGFIFTARNTAEVPLWLGTAFAARPLGLWLLLAFSGGGVLGLLLGLGLWRRMQGRIEVMQLRRRLQQAEKEVAILKHGKKPD